MKTFLLIISCLLGLMCPASAQDHPDPGSPGPAPTPRHVSPVTASAQAHPDPGYFFLDIKDALTAYGKLTGTKAVCDNTVQGMLVLPEFQDLGDKQKIEFIEQAIFLDGFTLSDAGDHVVAVLGLGKQPRAEGLPVYTKPEDLPSGERVFSYVIKLAHRKAQSVAAVLQQYIPPNNTAAFTPDEVSHSLIVTGRTSVVRSVLKLIPLLDVPEEMVVKAPETPPNTPRPPPVPRIEGNGGA